MAQVCEVCGKGPKVGNNVSHANNKSKRRFMPNLQRIRVDVNGTHKRMHVCTSCIKQNRVKKAVSHTRRPA